MNQVCTKPWNRANKITRETLAEPWKATNIIKTLIPGKPWITEGKRVWRWLCHVNLCCQHAKNQTNMSQALCWGLNLLQCPKTQQRAPTFEKKWMLQRKNDPCTRQLVQCSAQPQPQAVVLLGLAQALTRCQPLGPCQQSPCQQSEWDKCSSQLFGCFLKWWYPQNAPKWSFLVGKTMVVGYHHFRKPPFVRLSYLQQLSRRCQTKLWFFDIFCLLMENK